GAAHHRCGNVSSWWPPAHSITNCFFTKNAGAPWLGFSVTSGKEGQIDRTRSSTDLRAIAARYRRVPPSWRCGRAPRAPVGPPRRERYVRARLVTSRTPPERSPHGTETVDAANAIDHTAVLRQSAPHRAPAVRHRALRPAPRRRDPVRRRQ